MMLCTFTAMLLLWAYMLVYSCKHGIPYCLSVTYYGTKYKCVFPIFILLQVILVGIPMLDVTPDRWQFLCFLLATSLMGVAVAPFRDDTFKYKVHCICSLIAISCVCILCMIKGVGFLIPVVTCASLLASILIRSMSFREHWLLCVELTMFHLAYLYLFLLR